HGQNGVFPKLLLPAAVPPGKIYSSLVSFFLFSFFFSASGRDFLPRQWFIQMQNGSHHAVPMVSPELIIGNSLCLRCCVCGSIRQVCPVHKGNIVFITAESDDFSVTHTADAFQQPTHHIF